MTEWNLSDGRCMTGQNITMKSKKHAGKEFPFNIYPLHDPADFRQVPVHWHEEMELIVVKGRGLVTADLKPYEVAAGGGGGGLPGAIARPRPAWGSVHGVRECILPAVHADGIPDDACTAQFLTPLVMEGGTGGRAHTRESLGYEAYMACLRPWTAWGRSPAGYQLAVKGALFGFLPGVLTHYREAAPREAKAPGKRSDAAAAH